MTTTMGKGVEAREIELSEAQLCPVVPFLFAVVATGVGSRLFVIIVFTVLLVLAVTDLMSTGIVLKSPNHSSGMVRRVDLIGRCPVARSGESLERVKQDVASPVVIKGQPAWVLLSRQDGHYVAPSSFGRKPPVPPISSSVHVEPWLHANDLEKR